MCKSENARQERQTKKAYVRPQLVKHGNVETMTQNFRFLGSSGPINWDRN